MCQLFGKLWTKCSLLPSGDIQPPQLTSSSNYDKIIPETGMFQGVFKGPVSCPLVKLILTVSLFHRAFFNSIMYKTPTHALFYSTLY